MLPGNETMPAAGIFFRAAVFAISRIAGVSPELENRISKVFSTEEMIPSAGQGILALQGRKGMDYSCLDGFVSAQSAIAAAAERGFVSSLGGGCTSPIAAHAEFGGFSDPGGFGTDVNPSGCEPDTISPMTLRGFYYDEETCRIYRRKITVRAATPREGRAAGRELAAAVLAEAKSGKKG